MKASMNMKSISEFEWPFNVLDVSELVVVVAAASEAGFSLVAVRLLDSGTSIGIRALS